MTTSEIPFTSSLEAASLTRVGTVVVPESKVISPPLSLVLASVEFSLAICAKSAPSAFTLARTSLAFSSESNLITFAVISGV